MKEIDFDTFRKAFYEEWGRNIGDDIVAPEGAIRNFYHRLFDDPASSPADRKQEAILELYDAVKTPQKTFGEDMDKAEALYDRLAPLMVREFPRDKILSLISEYGHKVADDPDSQYIQIPSQGETLDAIKCLWEGDHIADSGKLVGLRPDAQAEKNRKASRGLAKVEQPKSTCQTCGGSKRVPIPRVSLEQENKYWEDCPDCTGECQHNDVMGIEGVTDKFYCCDCQRDLKTRRSRLERRVNEAYPYTSEYPDGEASSAMFVISEDHHAPDRRILKDRRNAEATANSSQAAHSARSGA